ncbi:flagellar protein FlgN [Bacillus sp. T3]|uniref:flagellar protein FlgN n=1 Tax=Bacillus sp. T3 TaxID=467262 RepID=UPI0029817787|nr:flagellar protein FlgN [Bacillus sp. T3]
MDSLKKLIEILVLMVDAHTRLLELTKEKRNVLIAGDHQSLFNITHRENSFAMEIEKLEVQRKQFAKEHLEKNGYAGISFTLEEIVQLQDNTKIKNTLNTIAKKLRSLVQEIANINKGNQQLIETALSYLNYSIGMFVQKEPDVGYGPKSKNGYARLLDAKV